MVLTSVLADNSMNFNENPNGNAILDMFRTQREDGRFCDIILHVSSSTHEEKLFPAHRSILAACSKYFESVLKTHRVTKEQINIECHDVDVFETLIDYMYCGNITIDWNNVNELIQLSHHFIMTNLTLYCSEFLEHYLSVDNCISVKDLADKYKLDRLCEVTHEFIGDNLSEIIDQPFMIEMSARKLESVLSDDSLNFLSLPVSQLLNFLVNWVKKDQRRANEFEKLLDLIEWNKLKLEFIYDHIDAEPLYRENKLFLYRTLKSLVSYSINITKYQDVYHDLVKYYEENDDEELIVAQDLDEDVLNSPIVVEPIESSNSRAKSKAKAAAARKKAQIASPKTTTVPVNETRRRSSRLVKDEPIQSAEEVEEENSNSAKRKRKQKYSKKEWETYSPSNKKLRNSKDKNNENEDKNEVNKDDDEEDEGDEEGTNEDEETQEEMCESGEEDNEENGSSSSSRKKNKSNFKINASLQHWKEGVKCPHCIYVGHSATRLEQHLAKVHEEDNTYICKICSFMCKWNREYYKHMKSHYEGPPYKCEDCEYTCDRIQFIISHRMRHTDERPYHCELCEFRSRTKGNLIVHMRIHTGEKPYKCPHCTRSFAMKNTLDQHLATHRDDRPFLCDSCGFTTKYQSHLLSHKRIHTGNVFHCQQEGCSYSSPRRSQLAAHTRSHLSIRSHICSTCGRAFIEKSHLIRHERIHLDEKPFKCEQCDYGSTRRDKLKEHVLKHHSAEGVAKTPYKPRKPRRQTTQNTSYIIEQSDEMPLVGTSSPQEIQISHGLSDHELCTATASLIYEYTDGGVTVSPARVVIQPSVTYSDGNHTIVERIVETQSGDNNSPSSARVVIQSIPSSYANSNQTEQGSERNNGENNTSGNELGGSFNAFIQALF